MANKTTIAVIGAGAWGTALANVLAGAARPVMLIARDGAAANRISRQGANPKLAGVRLADEVAVSADVGEAARADIVLIATPAQSLREATKALAPHLAPATPIIACAKGIEHGTRKFMTEIIAELLPEAHPAILSGPSFARDVARGLPTAVTIAARSENEAAELAQKLSAAAFRPYHTDDIKGVEIGGAAKNVLAIAAGIVAGKGLGDSAAAALTTRGFAELTRFGRALGARAETLMGLSGLGDLILSCSSAQSRNFSFGVKLGRGEALGDVQATTGLAEGVFTAPVLVDMARAHNIDMPVSTAVTAVLAGKLTVDGAIEALLSRPLRAEA
jgi:glycerol-3-phosphate dehydrogenase (NAD(P)+)